MRWRCTGLYLQPAPTRLAACALVWSLLAALPATASPTPVSSAPAPASSAPAPASSAPAPASSASASWSHIYGLVVGYNRSDDPEVTPLRYADDDAVQNALLLRELGGEVLLLVQPDPETAELYPQLVAQSPTHENLTAAMELLNAQIAAARTAGHSTALYLFYTGHGGVEGGEGYVQLAGSRLSRRDLTALVSTSRADQNHLVVDACKSYFMVFERGAGGRRRPLRVEQLVQEAPLPGNLGVLLSTSTAADSHEWEALQAGVFSHEVRSALRGGADLDGDGAVTYQEAAAFIWSANASIPNRRYRPLFFAQGPQQAGADPTLVALPEDRGDRLVIGPGISRHLYLEDGDGRRLADLHPGPEVRLALLLPTRRPLFVRHADSDQEVPIPEGRSQELAELPVRRATTAQRGAAHVAFTRLFGQPFGRDSLAAFRARPPEDAPDLDEPLLAPWFFPALGAAGVGLGLVGGGLSLAALWPHLEDTSPLSGVDRQEINDRIDILNGVAIFCYAAAGAAIAATAAHLVYELASAPDEELELISKEQEPR